MAREMRNRDDSIDALGLAVRVHNALRRASINTIGELSDKLQQDELWGIRNLGEKGIAEIAEKLETVDILTHYSESMLESRIGFSAASDIPIFVVPTIPVHKAIRSVQSALANQIRVRKLHPDLEIEGQPLVELVRSTRVHDFGMFAKLTNILTSSQSVADEIEILTSLAGLDDRQFTVLNMRHGYEKHTLGIVGDVIQVTRERVRQIETQVLQKLSPAMHSHSIARIRSAIMFADNIDLSFTDWSRGLLKSGLLGDWSNEEYIDYDPIEMMLAMCSITRAVEIPESLEYMIRLHGNGESTRSARSLMLSEKLTSEASRLISRHLRHSGAVSLEWLVNQEAIDYSIDELRLILESKGYFGLDENWYMSFEYVPGRLGKDSVIHRSLLKMFKYCGALAIRDVYAGIERTRVKTDFPIPPIGLLESMLLKCGYSFEGDNWYWHGETTEELNAGETVIWRTIEDYGGVAHHAQLMQAILDSGYAGASLHATLRRSPLFESFEKGLYRIRGSDPTYDTIAKARNTVERVSVELSVAHDTYGNILIGANLGILSIAYGTVVSEDLPNLSGNWEGTWGEDESTEIRVTHSEVRGLLGAIRYLECQVGDRIELIFNVFDRRVFVQMAGANT